MVLSTTKNQSDTRKNFHNIMKINYLRRLSSTPGLRSYFFPAMAVILLSSVTWMTTACTKAEPAKPAEVTPAQIFEFADSQLRLLLQEADAAILANPSENRGPHVNVRSIRDGQLFLIPSRDWTSGFLPGMLWFMYEYSGDGFWLAEAQRHTARIEDQKNTRSTHDLGFMVYNSFGNGYRLINEPAYRDVFIQASNSLITRYSPVVKAIRSWDHNRDKWDYPVIIDNMMNLEMLFRATEETGDATYRDIAIQHAITTMEQHFRADYSTYHVVDFNPETGAVQNRHTHQGAFHESAWARGQAWGLYGYTLMYRFTQSPEFLDQAEKIADFIMNHPRLPEDLIPYWDFDAETIPNAPRDASAAAITASAFYELSTMVPARSTYYKETADKILTNLYHFYRSADGGNFGFLLDHSTGHLPGNHEIDTPIIYADYYFLEAALRKKRLEES
jgi:unsaturated chondroitin disaccharide hydrolase